MLDSKKISSGYEICHFYNGTWQDWHIISQETVREFVRNIRNGKWCAILGPPRCQKSFLLDTIWDEIKRDEDKVCIKLDLRELCPVSDELFLVKFTRLFFVNLEKHPLYTGTKRYDSVNDETALQRFIQNVLRFIQKDLIVFLDHLESINITPRNSLLRGLDAVYTQSTANIPYRLVVVTTNSSVATEFDLDGTSAFKSGHLKIMKHLNSRAIGVLIDCISEYCKIEINSDARKYCIEQTAGDYNLTALLCESAVQYLRSMKSDELEKDFKLAGIPTFSVVDDLVMTEVINNFLDKEAKEYPFMQQTIQAIESDSATLLNVLKILENTQSVLELGTEVEANKLQRTGAVRIVKSEEGQHFAIRNKIYRDFLKKHFHPERVVHVLRSEGKWEEAIRYLTPIVSKERNYRSLLLETVVHSIYANQNENDTYISIVQALNPAFGIIQAEFYLENLVKRQLELAARAGSAKNRPVIISIDGEQPELPSEVRAYFGEEYFKDFEDVLYVPVAKESKRKLGLLAIHNFQFNPQESNSLRLLSFLKQVGRAIGHVIDRKSRLNRLKTLNTMREKLSSSLDLQQILNTTVKASLRAIELAHSCDLYLWDDSQAKLILKIHKRKDKKSDRSQGILEDYVIQTFKQKEPIIWPKGSTSFGTSPILHADGKIKSAICVPLEAWGKSIGVIGLENSLINDAFQDTDIGVLSAFIAQAAVSIQNARLHKELYELGILFNQGNVDPEKIFEHTVNSILRVSDANASHMLLLNNTNDPEKCLSRDPKQPKAAGVLAPLDGKIKPRPDGLTFAVLEKKQPQEVSNPEDGPGLPEAIMEYGIKACLCLPMMIRKVIIGVLYVHYKNEHVFSPNEIEMLSLFANQAAAAIQNSLLNLKREEQTKRLKVLHRISSKILSRLDLKKILDTIAEDITRLLNAERSLFLLFDDKKLYIKAGYPDKDLEYLSHQEVMEGMSGWVCKTGKPCKSRDASKDIRQQGDALNRVKLFGTGPIAIAPLKSKGTFLGTLTAVNQRGQKAFTRKDLDLACMFANQAAVAIQNARYVEEIKEISKREKLAASIASHDFWTPLEIISSSVKILKRKTSCPSQEEENVKEKFQIIEETIPFFSCVASQGNFIDPNWVPRRKENLFIFELVEEVIRLFRLYAKYKGNKTLVRDKNLEKIEHKYLDKQATKQVFFNLIINAIKYSYPNHTIQICNGKPPEGFSDAVEITNTGEGIKEKEINKIFKFGVRGEHKAMQPHGHGKGLYIARKIMIAQRGDVVLLSPADPTKFGIYFP